MKTQLSIFDNEARAKKVKDRKNIRISMEVGIPKEYATKSGKVFIVEKKRESLSGVGMTTYYAINFEGKVIKPVTTKGIKNFINNN